MSTHHLVAMITHPATRHWASFAIVVAGGAIAAWLVSWATTRVWSDWRSVNPRLPRALQTVGQLLGGGAIVGATALTAQTYLPPRTPGYVVFGLALLVAWLAAGLPNLAGTLAIAALGLVRRGDRVRFGGYLGTVQRVGPFRTLLVTDRHGRRRVPNRTVLQSGVVHATAHSVTISLPICLAYTVEEEIATAMLLEAALRTRGLATQPIPEPRVIAASNEAVRYEVIARLVGPQSEAMVVSHFRVNLLAVLGENGFGPEALGVDQVPALPYGLPAFAR